MDDNFLYQQIAQSIRQEMLSGKLQPGDNLGNSL
jgi:DNA-binding transcriptional regulator YhcF (GntR family)